MSESKTISKPPNLKIPFEDIVYLIKKLLLHNIGIHKIFDQNQSIKECERKILA